MRWRRDVIDGAGSAKRVDLPVRDAAAGTKGGAYIAIITTNIDECSVL